DISKEINGIPEITTASDSRGFDSINIIAKDNDHYIEDMKSITKLTSMIVNNRRIDFITEHRQNLNYITIKVLDSLEDIEKYKEDINGLIIVNSKMISNKILKDNPYNILRAKNINIGIGCRKNVEGKRIRSALETALSTVNISNRSIKGIG